MTIEKEFFDAFGIEPSKHFFCGKHLPRYKCVCWDRARQRNSYCKDWDYKNKKCEFYTEDIERRFYPPITPEIVLKLAATLNDIVFPKIECCCLFTGKTVEEITNNILSDCIDHKDEIQDQVKALFNA